MCRFAHIVCVSKAQNVRYDVSILSDAVLGDADPSPGHPGTEYHEEL